MKFMDRTKLIPVLLVLLLLCGLVPASCAESVSPAYDISRLNYELVWADEFDTDGLPDPVPHNRGILTSARADKRRPD